MTVTTPPPPERDYSPVRNGWMRDSTLTWAEKGMLAYIGGHTAEHPLSMEQIIAEGAEGADAARSVLRGLEVKGWLKRTPVRGYRGRIIRYDYTIGEPAPVVDLTGLGPTASGGTASGPTASGEAATSHDQAKQGVSAGPTACRPTASGQPGTKKTNPKKTKEKTNPSATQRGTRLPDGWVPDEELLTWFVTELVAGNRWSVESREALRREHDKFGDYWRSAAGARGVKLDWAATWRNWMRRAFERPIGPAAAPGAERLSFAEQDRRRRDEGDRRAAAIDAVMEQRPGISVREAARLVDDEIANRVDGRTGGAYIEGVATSGAAAPEVTA